LFFLMVVNCGLVAAPQNLQLLHTDLPVTVDGTIEEQAWDGVPVLLLNYQTQPQGNQLTRIKTEVKLLEDGQAIYFAFIAYDPDVNHIRSFLRARDQGDNDDRVIVSLDTFDNAQLAYRFSVNAAGVQMDEIRNEV